MGRFDLHCNIDEKTFSWAIFLSRLITGGSLLYITMGCLFFHREFFFNLIALRVPVSVPMGFTLVVLELFAALFLVLGWFTRIAAAVSFFCTVLCGVVFFAGDFNKIFVALCLFLLSPLITILLLGPGRISLDFSHAQRKTRRFFRG